MTRNIHGEELAPSPDAIDFANGVPDATAAEAARRYHVHDELVAAARALLAYVEGGPISPFGRERCERLRAALGETTA